MDTIAEKRSCAECQNVFPVLGSDVEFYKKMKVPLPTRCQPCREKRRLAWRSEWKFYKRTCDLTGQKIISYISPESKQKVYSLDAWFSDKWDGRDYGRPYDFERPFFEQFKELLQATPHIPLLIGECENSVYTNYSWGNKNCYMVSAADFNKDSFYSGYLFQSRDCSDCFFVNDSELCYECLDCDKCYNCSSCQSCKNCQDSEFCYECARCTKCIGCVNLRDKNFCVFNRQLTKEEYESQKRELEQNPEKIKQQFEEIKSREPHQAMKMTNCDNCVGNNLSGCKNCFACFDLIDSQDCRYVTYGSKSKDCMDVNGAPSCELVYESVANPQCYNCLFCSSCWVKSSFLTYCHLLRACSNCFGCVSLHRNSYCILNKQYKKEEYEELVPRIIQHMQKPLRAHVASAQASEGGSHGSHLSEAELNNQEWGEFFPVDVSPF